MNHEQSTPNFLQPLNPEDFGKPVVITGAERAGVLASPQPESPAYVATNATDIEAPMQPEEIVDPITAGLTPLQNTHRDMSMEVMTRNAQATRDSL